MENLKILIFQIKLNIENNHYKEFLLIDDDYKNQMEESFEIIQKLKPDIVVYPELSYDEKYKEKFVKMSLNCLIVAGSIYIGNINTTMVFENGILKTIPKSYASGAEPMARYVRPISYKKFEKYYLKDHLFKIKNKNIVILNCAEYYNVAYYIARNIDNIFGFLVPCMNSNPTVFEEETMAINNHNEKIYSFIVNSISSLNGKNYSTGQSYIYGPIHQHEKEWLKDEGYLSKSHNSYIIKCDDEESYIYGEFTDGYEISHFGRSDFYSNNPKNLILVKRKKAV